MYGITNDKRRATRDLDLDFIKYSLDDNSIKLFINKLNSLNDGIKILIDGQIKELHHQDYKGKRVNIKLKDKNNFSISTKLDIGVHKKFDIKQDKYCFNLEAINESVTLIINSKEQIIGEKLKSLLKFGIRTTRFKDVFDIYYLLNNTNINKTELLSIINSLIINDSLMRENDIDEVVSNLETILNNNIFKRNLSIVKNNWLELSVDKVVDNVIKYFNELKTSLVP